MAASPGPPRRSLGALFALIICTVKRRPNRETFVRLFMEALRTVSAVFLVAIGAILLTRFLAMAGVPRCMAKIAQQFDADVFTVILAMKGPILFSACP